MAQSLNGGAIIVKSLEAQGVERVFCVPGESYLPVLDALQDSTIDTVLARHEGGAAMMAEADGKMTGRPGIALVTRGPGATNASAGIHIAQQDSTALILLVGQVARESRGRDAFQEVDFSLFFSDMAKYVHEVDDVKELAKIMADSFKIAMEGRPGPVVIALPEDMLYDCTEMAIQPYVTAVRPAPKHDDILKLQSMLAEATRPMVIVGGSVWDSDDAKNLSRFAASYDLPVACSFRRQRLMQGEDLSYAGDLGLGCNPKLIDRIKNADLLLLLGGRLSEIPSQSYRLLTVPKPQMPFVHIHPADTELGRVYTPDLAIHASPKKFLELMMADLPGLQRHAPCPEHEAYREWSETIPSPPGAVNMAEIMLTIRSALPDESIITNGAGNYATWIHRFFRFRHFQSQLAPTSGTMGYGIPAAVAAKARFPKMPVIAFAGDGCFQMTMQEMATAKQIGAGIIVIVVDNGIYGTIRMHQESHFPGRIQHTELVNPDFVLLGKSMGFNAEKITKTNEFKDSFIRCLKSEQPSLIHIVLDPEAISPTRTLSEIRQASIKESDREH